MSISLNSVIDSMNQAMASTQSASQLDLSGSMSEAFKIANRKEVPLQDVKQQDQGKQQFLDQVKKKIPGVTDLINPQTQVDFIQTQDLGTQSYINSAFKVANILGVS